MTLSSALASAHLRQPASDTVSQVNTRTLLLFSSFTFYSQHYLQRLSTDILEIQRVAPTEKSVSTISKKCLKIEFH